MKNLLVNFGLLLGVCLFFFFGIEFGLRITGLQTVKPNPPRIYERSEDPRINYQLIPNKRTKAFRNIVTTNSLGFRSPEIDPAKPTIALLGDSITFGYGVADNETIPAFLGEFLPRYNVVNTAVPGYHIGMQTAVYENIVDDLKAETLIVVFHPNDVDTGSAWLDDDGILRAEGWEPGDNYCSPITTGILKYVPAKCWLDSHSAFYKAFKKLVNSRYSRQTLAETRSESQAEEEVDSITYEKVDGYIRLFDELAGQLPPKMNKVFVIWPDRFMHNVSRPYLTAQIERRNFKVLDMYNTFGNEVEILGWDTVHPSANSTKKGAEVLHQFLVENSLVR